MAVARLTFPSYQSSNENGGGSHAWQSIQSAGSTTEAGGAFDVRDPNSADMNWLRSYGDGARGSASIPAGSTIRGIVVGFQVHQYGGNQTGGTYNISLFKNGSVIGTPKTGGIAQGGVIGPFGSSTDLWGLTGLTPEYFSSGIYFGHHCNFPNITSNITMYSWNGYMDIYYDAPVNPPAAVSVISGDNQSATTNTQFNDGLVVKVTDSGGIALSGISVTFTLPASGASALFTNGQRTCVGITTSAGVTSSLAFIANGNAGTWQPVADVTGSSPLIYTTFNMTNVAPPVLTPTTMTIVQGNNQSAAVSTTFAVLQKVQVKDQFGANLSGSTVSWAVPATRGTYPGSLTANTLTDSSGIATAPQLTAGSNAGAWTGTATVSGFASVNQSFSFTNIANTAPPQANSMNPFAGGNQSAALNTAFLNNLQFQVLDQSGSVFPGSVVTAVIPSASMGAFQSGGQSKAVTTNSSGVADFGKIVAGPVANDSWSITASASGTSGATVFGLKNVDATVPTNILTLSGQGQTAAVDTNFAAPLRAHIQNGLGAGVQNVSVVFTAPATGASCTFLGNATQTVLTDANGYATSAVPVAVGVNGAYTVKAETTVGLARTTAQTNFALTNGFTYLPEVCTAMETAPSGAINSSVGSFGSPASWTSPNLACAAATGGSYAWVYQPIPNTNKSNSLLFTPEPASWTAAGIKDDAKITSISVSAYGYFDSYGQGSGAGTLSWGFARSNVSVVGGLPLMNAPTDSWGASGVKKYTVAAGVNISGADLRLGYTGVTINYAPASNQRVNANCRINGVTMQVCYQNVDTPQTATIPLLVCEV